MLTNLNCMYSKNPRTFRQKKFTDIPFDQDWTNYVPLKNACRITTRSSFVTKFY